MSLIARNEGRYIGRGALRVGWWHRLQSLIASTRVMKSYHLRKQVGPTPNPRVECLTNPNAGGTHLRSPKERGREKNCENQDL